MDEGYYEKEVEKFKYFRCTIDKEGIKRQEINQSIQNERKVIGALHSILWNKNISPKNKKNIGQTMVDKVLTYGSEVWEQREDDKRNILVIEMEYLH